VDGSEILRLCHRAVPSQETAGALKGFRYSHSLLCESLKLENIGKFLERETGDLARRLPHAGLMTEQSYENNNWNWNSK